MKLTAQIKLLPDKSQAEAHHVTLRAANDACNFVSRAAWKGKNFSQFDLHHLCYKDVRSKFNLSAQVAVRMISKVADSYKLDWKTERKFKSTGSIAYDDRIVSWRIPESRVSIWTTSGRIRVPFVCGDLQRDLLLSRKGETDLIFRKGKFYLSATCEVKSPDKTDTIDVLGIDLGIKNITVDSDGTVHSSGRVNNVRHRHRRLRTTLSSWSFNQFRTFITYNAEREGVTEVFVDPRNTSRTCPECGTIDKRNRKSQRIFSCALCGFAGLADHIAAENICRAAVNQPIVARVDAEAATLKADLKRSEATSPVL